MQHFLKIYVISSLFSTNRKALYIQCSHISIEMQNFLKISVISSLFSKNRKALQIQCSHSIDLQWLR